VKVVATRPTPSSETFEVSQTIPIKVGRSVEPCILKDVFGGDFDDPHMLVLFDRSDYILKSVI
jgi:hypothetical protein